MMERLVCHPRACFETAIICRPVGALPEDAMRILRVGKIDCLDWTHLCFTWLQVQYTKSLAEAANQLQ
ncbi:hypothetical protein AS026_38740 [Rhizobium altiplani]|uniref:Uncharacterized protein n=1 Tax=Rhizobium altiplani TaxID=1864509 RepID=A0A109JFR7_9HYPH|nr:hypothetical protein AS026_24515 [Rhizobium altiplani]KWV48012.1 hypothetical protein AS026_12310 [Rhizobium altiplani]KWV48055.1 hypothetical protein AS026_12115 [Rhizobium altiplani]KWV54588.1 hypothetical protein AS026_38740 [Rhizobium altiplani]